MRKKFISSRKLESFKVLRVGVFCGGRSSERSISIRSGKAVKKALDSAGLKSVFFDPGKPEHWKKRFRKLDLAFLAVHGTGGEDGRLQARLERLGMAYTGSGVRASRQAFDKKKSKACFKKHQIPTPHYQILTAKTWQTRLKKLKAPWFIKPVADGSSVGVFRAENNDRDARKIKKSLKLYKELLAEESIHGRELTVGILGEQCLPVIEVIPSRPFYDYKAKYTTGMTRYIVPAVISAKLAKRLQRTALRVHRALGLRDFSRVDFMVDRRERIYVLEANSIPGLTSLSLVPKAAKAAGISFENLCLKLIEYAKDRR